VIITSPVVPCQLAATITTRSEVDCDDAANIEQPPDWTPGDERSEDIPFHGFLPLPPKSLILPAECQHRYPQTVNRRKVWVICRRPECSEECRRGWRFKHAVCLASSLLELPAHYFVRVTMFEADDNTITTAEKCLLRMLGRRHIEYCWYRHWQRPGVGRHLHLLLRCPDGEEPPISRLWRETVGKWSTTQTSYCEPIKTQGGSAWYITNASKDRKHQIVPLPSLGFQGHLHGFSSDFLYDPGIIDSRGKKLPPLDGLWERQKRQWYPEASASA